MDCEILGHLLDGLFSFEGFEPHPGFAGGVGSFSFGFHFGWFRFDVFTATVHENYSSTRGPNFGAHLSSKAPLRMGAPTGQNAIAQGNALGPVSEKNAEPCRGALTPNVTASPGLQKREKTGAKPP